MGEFSDVRFKQRAVAEFLTVEKVPPIEIHRRMQAVYGDQCVDVGTVRRWVRQFKNGELGFKNKTPIFLRTDFKN
jgi:transposase-like protein